MLAAAQDGVAIRSPARMDVCVGKKRKEKKTRSRVAYTIAVNPGTASYRVCWDCIANLKRVSSCMIGAYIEVVDYALEGSVYKS